MPRRRYHHGDLKPVIVATALEVLAEDGLQALSLRKVARRAGVSHNAPYMHFDDKNALLAAIADEGFRELEAAMRRTLESGEAGSREQLVRLGEAYVAFARARPQHLQVMFADLRDAGPPRAASRGTFELLVDTVAAGQERGTVAAGDPRELATALWSLVHGFATLRNASRLGAALIGRGSPEGFERPLLERLVRGFGADG